MKCVSSSGTQRVLQKQQGTLQRLQKAPYRKEECTIVERSFVSTAKNTTNYGSVPTKTGTKIYGRTEGDRRNEPATPIVGKQHFILRMAEKTHGEWQGEKTALVTTQGNHSNNKKAYTNRLKSPGRKVGFAAVIVNITKRGAHYQRSIHSNSNEWDTKKKKIKVG